MMRRLSFVLPEEAIQQQPEGWFYLDGPPGDMSVTMRPSEAPVRVLKGEEAEAFQLREAGYIELPDEIVTTNVVEEYKSKGEDLPAGMAQVLHDYDFHRLDFDVLLRNYKWTHGTERLEMDARITGGGAGYVQVTDVGPKTEWVPGDYKGEVTLEIGYDFLGGLLKLVPIKLTGATSNIKAKFDWTWAPKIGRVTSGGTGQDAEWNFSKAKGEYLDGGRSLQILIRRPRQIDSLTLVIDEARARYDLMGTMRDRVVTAGPIDIPVKFTESARR